MFFVFILTGLFILLPIYFLIITVIYIMMVIKYFNELFLIFKV